MSVVKTAAYGLLIWAASLTAASADSISSGSWTVFGGDGLGNVTIADYSPVPTSNSNNSGSSNSSNSSSSSSSATASPFSVPTGISGPDFSSNTGPVDAFVNLGNGPYPNAQGLTTGNPQAWYNSQQISGFFGGQPTAQQQADFDNSVLQRVQQAFQLSGVNVTLTDNPNVPAAHTLSLVSNSASTMGNAIGLTYLGANGFSFIDQIAPSASSLSQLESIVAHNIAHELMISFGVGEKYDQSGNYIDARNANFSMMVDPNATFSSAAAQALNSAIASINFDLANSAANPNAEPQFVPEPATFAVWGLAAAGALFARRRASRRSVR
jgi:hypothetical protein